VSRARSWGLWLWLVVLWVAFWHDLSVANVVSGVLVGALVLVSAGVTMVSDDDDRTRARVRPIATVHFVVYVVYELVVANLYLAWEIVTPRNKINVGVVAVPMRTESELVANAVANVITLTPGSVTIESLGSPAVLYVNVMHLHDLDDVRRDLLKIEELAVRAFGSRAAREQLREAGTP
jgi:multicomponent Na+:H+ antiporter subunit E